MAQCARCRVEELVVHEGLTPKMGERTENADGQKSLVLFVVARLRPSGEQEAWVCK